MNKIKNFFNNTKFGKWLKKTGIKSVKTMAEASLAIIGTNTIGITDVDWAGLVSAAILSGFVTILINIADINTVDE